MLWKNVMHMYIQHIWVDTVGPPVAALQLQVFLGMLHLETRIYFSFFFEKHL